MMERYFSLKPMGEGYLNIYKALAGGQPVPPQGG
jgi:hypothetical protein